MRTTRKQRMHGAAVKIVEDNIGVPKLGCEVGIWAGELSFAFLRAFEDLNLYMVDCFLASSLGDDTKTQGAMVSAFSSTSEFEQRRIMLIGKSLQVAHLVEDESLDFVYIDAAHDRKSVTDDINSWYPKVRSGGIVSGHDYSGGHKGLRKAVDEFTDEHHYKMSLLTTNWWFIKR